MLAVVAAAASVLFNNIAGPIAGEAALSPEAAPEVCAFASSTVMGSNPS